MLETADLFSEIQDPLCQFRANAGKMLIGKEMGSVGTVVGAIVVAACSVLPELEGTWKPALPEDEDLNPININQYVQTMNNWKI